MPDDRARAATRLIRFPLQPPAIEETRRLPTAAVAALHRLDAATAELERSLAQSQRMTEEVQRFAQDVDSDKISTDGVVLEPFEDEDTVVRCLRDALHASAG